MRTINDFTILFMKSHTAKLYFQKNLKDRIFSLRRIYIYIYI